MPGAKNSDVRLRLSGNLGLLAYRLLLDIPPYAQNVILPKPARLDHGAREISQGHTRNQFRTDEDRIRDSNA
jgi:hypothetical protein